MLSSRYSDLLWAGPSGDRIPVGARFSAPVQTDPGAHPASYTMDTGSFPGVKRPGRGVDHPPPSSAEVKERVELYLYSSSGPS
jgi:DNA-binding sugar fermentation-stimulating protein